MKDWFANLQPRERWLFVGGSVVAVLVLLWMLVLSPLRAGSADLRDAVAAKQRLLTDLARIEGAAGGNVPGVARDGQESLAVLVASTAQAHGLTFPRTRPDGADAINVTFQNASFDALVEWLIVLQTTHAVAVESASVSSAREQGLVNGQLLLRRS